jgi:hypothetical protein
MRHLHGIGWTPMEDEEGELGLVGTTADGRNGIALYGEESIGGAGHAKCFSTPRIRAT